MRLQGKVAIITGAGRGIGFAGASAFVREGAKVVIAEIDEALGHEAEAKLRAMGGDLAALSPEDLMRLACEGPLASGLLDEAVLAPYLEGRSPQACR